MKTSRVVALALLVGTFFVAQDALTDLVSGTPIRVANDVEAVLRLWIVWALLTPFDHLYGGAASAQLRPANGTADSRGTRVEIRIPIAEVPR